MFPRAGVTGVLIFSSKRQRSRLWIELRSFKQWVDIIFYLKPRNVAYWLEQRINISDVLK